MGTIEHSVASISDTDARFRAIFKNAAVGIARVALDGRFLEVNERLCEILGYTSDELLTKTFGDITHPEDLETDLRGMKRMLAGEVATYLREKRYRRTDGSVVWANLTVSLAQKADGFPQLLHFSTKRGGWARGDLHGDVSGPPRRIRHAAAGGGFECRHPLRPTK